MSRAPKPRAEVIEQHTIDFVPLSERRGKARDLFGVWFPPNASLTLVVLGALCASFGMSLPMTILAILVGNLFGTLFSSAHSAQGPVMGVPQMIQTRAQFGIRGSVLPIVLALGVQLGYFAVLAVLCGQIVSEISGISVEAGIVISSLLVLVITVFGYDALRRFAGIVSWLSVALILAIAVKVFFINDTPVVPEPADNFANFLLVVAIMVSAIMTWAPFVADYSRYLPQSTSRKAAFWYSSGGIFGGATIAAVLGAVLFVQDGAADSVSSIASIFGSSLSWIVLAIFFLGLIQANVLDLYSASLSSLTLIESFATLRDRVNRKTLRWIFATAGALAMTVLAIIATRGDFLIYLENFALVLLYLLLPWTAINLVDFYLVRKGHYRTEDLFDHDGPYRGTRWGTVLIFCIAVAVQLPFINSGFYVGFWVDALGGADISWIVGLVVAAGLQYFYETRMRRDAIRIDR